MPSYRSPRDGSLVSAFPGISCQATFIQSLRDKVPNLSRKSSLSLAPIGTQHANTSSSALSLKMDIQAPYIPENAPFSPAQRAWLNGFLAGLFSQQSATGQAAPKIRANVYFGTETGNSEAVAKQTAKFLQSRGFESQAVNLSKISSIALAGEAYALIVISTFGDGDPPDSAKAFYAELHAPDHPRLSELRYSVLALGDRNYERFCQCGQDIDVRLEMLGGQRIYQRVDCDVDYEAAVGAWRNGVVTVLEAASPLQPAKTEAKASPTPEPTAVVPDKSSPAGEIVYDRKHPFLAQVSANRLLTAPASAKETRHFEISLDGSNLSYAAGDALGIVPCNCPELVEQILKALNCDGEEAVPAPHETEVPLHKALRFAVFCTNEKRSARPGATGCFSETRKRAPISFIRTNYCVSKRMAFSRGSTRLFRGISPRKFMFSRGCSKTQRNYGPGLKKAPISTYVAMLKEWQKMSMLLCTRS
jgi:flavodoxin